MKPPSAIPTAALYLELRGDHLPRVFTLREPADFHEPIPVSERLVQVIWADQLFNPNKLHTRDGTSLRILSPGRWNAEGGPDFSGARLRIGEVAVTGDVEIHVHATGWDEHGHAADPAYNRVILDVCLWNSEGPIVLRRQDGRMVPQLALHSFLECSLDELLESVDPDRYPFSPIRAPAKPAHLTRLPPSEIALYVESAGVFRFEQKTARILEAIAKDGANQAAYRFLAGALGYKHNQPAFHQIATSLPIATLLGHSTADQKIEALLAEARRQPVRIHQVRPSNHPHRRLAALALIAQQHPRLDVWFREIPGDRKRLRNPPELQHPFWSWRYHAATPRLSRPLALLGRTRWKEVVANVVLPFCRADAQARGDVVRADHAFRAYLEIRASQANRASRQMTYDLGIPAPVTALQQQGMIQMYQDFDLLLPDAPIARPAP